MLWVIGAIVVFVLWWMWNVHLQKLDNINMNIVMRNSRQDD